MYCEHSSNQEFNVLCYKAKTYIYVIMIYDGIVIFLSHPFYTFGEVDM